MNKTGRIVTEINLHFLTDAELQGWNDAVDEHYQKVEAGDAPIGSLPPPKRDVRPNGVAQKRPRRLSGGDSTSTSTSRLTAKGGAAI